MMSQILLKVPQNIYVALEAHLLPEDSLLEEVAFMYAHPVVKDGKSIFQPAEWQPIHPEGFVYRSEIGLELTDETRASVIKRAHDLGASLIEFHSHSGPWPAQFSPSDWYGFTEFVPHVWWRLKGRPYLSVVMTRTGFDALAWTVDPTAPQRLDGIFVGAELVEPTRLSPLTGDAYYE
jgi:hypothetical protein